MGIKRQVHKRTQQSEPVDGESMPEWEADTASHVGAWLLFWCWYWPREELRRDRQPPAALAALIRGRALLRYPLDTAPVRGVAAKVPARR